MLPITITALDAASVLYSTFSSYKRSVVITAYGIFAVYLHDTDPHGGDISSSLTVYTWRLARSTDGGQTFTTVYTGTGASAPPVIEADPNGVLYLAYGRLSQSTGNWDTSDATFLRFDKSNGFSAPTLTATLTNLAGGKYNLLLDWPRQQFYYSSWGRWLAILNLDGTIKTARRAFLSDSLVATPEYPHFALDETGVLYAGVTTTPLAAPTSYRSIQALRSLDGGISWQSLAGTPLGLPIVCDDSGPTTLVSLLTEVGANPWLWSLLAGRGKLHLAYFAVFQPGSTPRVMHYVRFDTATGVKELDTTPWQGETLVMGNLDGALIANPVNGRLYAVSKNNDVLSTDTRIVALYSDDRGTTWHDYGQSASLGAPSSTQTAYSKTAARLATPSGSLVGMFTLTPNTTPSTQFWHLVGSDPVAFAGSVAVVPAVGGSLSGVPVASGQVVTR